MMKLLQTSLHSLKSKLSIRNIVEYIFIICLCIFVVCSEFSLWQKMIALGIIFVFFFALKYSEQIGVTKYTVIIALMVVTTVSNLWSAGWETSYWDYLSLYGWAYNKNTKWATTQNPYAWNTGNSDVILPTLLQDKNAYVVGDSIYDEYINYFAEDVKLLVDSEAFDCEVLKTQFLQIGRMSIEETDFLFEPDEKKALDENKARNNVQATLYISSSDVAKAETIVVFSDDVYNMYILTWEEYELLVNSN